jgi:hypothetical protein
MVVNPAFKRYKYFIYIYIYIYIELVNGGANHTQYRLPITPTMHLPYNPSRFIANHGQVIRIVESLLLIQTFISLGVQPIPHR